jgi:GDPmannose 4,6-dehydratase
MKKRAFITGVNGQDGVYLSELLIEKGYEVLGLVRRNSQNEYSRVERLKKLSSNFDYVQGDLTDSMLLTRAIGEFQPDEVYNLGAMSHVGRSFTMPEHTADVDGVGVLRLLEAIRINKLEKKTKFYQASTSELFGDVHETPQRETTPFHPRSPYGVAKLYGYWITVNYRESYNMFACNGILFNHESPMRGKDFVTRKITNTVAQIKLGLETCLHIGNLDAQRDWGYAKDYVEGMWKMLQLDQPEDFVLATGVTTKVRDFVEKSFKAVDIEISWKGTPGSREETGVSKKTGDVLVKIDPQFFRPAEVELLLGDATKAKEKLNWEATTQLDELCKIMINSDLEELRSEFNL